MDLICKSIKDRETPIRIPLSETITLSKFAEYQREAKRECINLQLEDITPVPSVLVDQMREELEFQLFKELAVIEEIKYCKALYPGFDSKNLKLLWES